MADLEWGVDWGSEPEMPALRRAVHHQLRSQDRSMRILAEDFLACESTIDLLAVGGEGELISIRIGRPGEDAALLTRSLSDLVWLRRRTRDLIKLIPGLGIEPSADARSILLCPEFGSETLAAIENFPSDTVEPVLYRCYRHRGRLNVILEPQKQRTTSLPRRLESREQPASGTLEQLPDPPAARTHRVAGSSNRRNAPEAPLNLARTSDFRTGLTDADLRLEADENPGLDWKSDPPS